MRSLARTVVVVGALAAGIGLSGCGSNGTLLSQGAATQLNSDLTQASSALNQYNCTAAYSALTNFQNDVSELQGVNRTLLSMLSQGASTITALAENRCPTGTTATTATDTTTTATDTTTTGTDTTTTTNPDTATDTDTSPLDTTTDTSTTGGQAPDTATTTPEDTVPTPSTPTAPPTVPDSGGAGLGSTAPTGGTGVGGATP